MQVKDQNPYSSKYDQITEAEVTFMFKGYEIKVATDGTGPLNFDGATQKFTVVDTTGNIFFGTGDIETAIIFILNKESL